MRSSRTKFQPDRDKAWPHFKHDHEVGGRPYDCQFCQSPRVFFAGDKRICASCGYTQKPSDTCLACGTQLNTKSMEIQAGLCTECRHKAEEADASAAPTG